MRTGLFATCLEESSLAATLKVRALATESFEILLRALRAQKRVCLDCNKVISFIGMKRRVRKRVKAKGVGRGQQVGCGAHKGGVRELREVLALR